MGEYIVNKIRKEIERQKPKSGSMTVGLGKYWFSGPDIEALLSRYEQKSEQLTTLQAEKERLEGELGRLTTPRPIETAPKDGSHFLIVYNDGEIRMGHYLDNSDKQYPWAGYQSLYGSVGVTRKMVSWLPIPTQEPTNGS